MAGNNIKGITIEINGNTEPLNRALKGVNKSSYDLKQELKQVEKGLKLDPTNVNLLRQKQQLLAQSVTNTREKLATLKTAERQAQQQFAEGRISAEQYRALQREVISTEQELRRLETAARRSNVTLNRIAETSKKIAQGSKRVGQTMLPVTLAIGAAGAVAVKAGSDYIESLNKVDVAFGKNSKEVKDWSETTLEKFGMAKGSALETASLFGDMGTAMGLTTGEAAKMSMSLGGLGADLSSFKNISLEQSQTALKGIFTGEGEALKTLGIVMQDTTLKEFAHAKGIKKKYEQMTQAEKVNLRYNFVMEKTKNAQGDFARTSDGAANSMRVASESAKEASASIGVMLAPIVAKAAQYIANLVKNFTKLDESTKKIILIVLALIAIIAPLAFLISGVATIIGAVTTVMGLLSIAKLKDIAQTVILNALYAKDAIVKGASTVAQVALSVATGAWNIVCGIATAVTTGLGIAFTFLTSPIGLVILAIAAVIAIGVLLYKNWDTVKAFMIKIFTSIKNTAVNIFNSLLGFFKKWGPLMLAIITGPIGLLVYAIVKNWDKIKSMTSSIFNAIKSIAISIWNGIKNGIDGTVNGIKSTITNVWNGIKNTTTNVWNGIKNAIINPVNAAKNGVKNAIDAIKGFFSNIHLPEIKIPKIKLPHFGLTGEFSLVPPKVPKLNVDWYDKGGVFSSPGVIGIAEKRPEFVGALDDLRYLIRDELNKNGQPQKAGGAGEKNINVVINNPVAETSTASTKRQLTRLSYMGVV